MEALATATGVPQEYILTLILGICVAYLFTSKVFGLFQSMIYNFVAIIYPAYKSL